MGLFTKLSVKKEANKSQRLIADDFRDGKVTREEFLRSAAIVYYDSVMKWIGDDRNIKKVRRHHVDEDEIKYYEGLAKEVQEGTASDVGRMLLQKAQTHAQSIREILVSRMIPVSHTITVIDTLAEAQQYTRESMDIEDVIALVESDKKLRAVIEERSILDEDEDRLLTPNEARQYAELSRTLLKTKEALGNYWNKDGLILNPDGSLAEADPLANGYVEYDYSVLNGEHIGTGLEEMTSTMKNALNRMNSNS